MTGIYYSLAIIALFFFMRILVKDIREGLLVGIIFMTFSRGALPWDVLPINGIAFAIFLCINALAFIRLILLEKRINVNWSINKYQISLIAYLFIVIFFLILSPSQTFGISKTVFFTINSILPIFIILSFQPLSERDTKLIFKTIVTGALLASLRIFTLVNIASSRIEVSPLSLSRTAGLGACLLLIFLLNTELNKKHLKNILSAVFVLSLCILGMLFTGSRGPILGVILVALSALVFSDKKLPRKFLIVFKAALIFYVVLLIFSILPIELNQYRSVNRVIEYVTNIIDVVFRQSGQQDLARSMLFNTAYEGFIESNLLGVGTGGFAYLWGSDGAYPHNIFLEIAVEQGIIGLTILLYILLKSFILSKKQLKRVDISVYGYSLNYLWLFGFFNAQVSGDISTNILWITLVLLWIRKEVELKNTTQTKLNHNLSGGLNNA